MAVQVPVHPDAIDHEPLDDVLEADTSSRTQRWIAWLCGILTLAAAIATWRLL